jgi:hypothetical protein
MYTSDAFACAASRDHSDRINGATIVMYCTSACQTRHIYLMYDSQTGFAHVYSNAGNESVLFLVTMKMNVELP